MTDQPQGFQPLVAAQEDQPELTLRAVLLGAVLGIVFGAASTYLALRVGLTVSASVPIAVIAIALLRPRGGKRAILEHNITQTTGSAGESVAAAVVFTVPALILLGFPLEVGLTTLIALTGGILGVLMMVPLRRYLIVKEHGKLRYPEGKACAEILRVGELGGTSAKKVFVGMAVGASLQALKAVLGGVKSTVGVTLDKFFGNNVAYFGKTQLACDFDPALLGVGYIIGYRTSLIMVAGSLLSSLILLPMVYTFGHAIPGILGVAPRPIAELSNADIYKYYVKQIGAGAVAAGGIFALIRALPSIWSALSQSTKSLLGGGAGASTARTDRDTPVSVLLFGAIGLVVAVWLVPIFQVNLAGAVMILVFGFLFSVVSSRITGEVGSTSNPLSGMTIAVLMGTCGIFVAAGMGQEKNAVLVLMIGAIVCIAISQAGTCSQDLKTGFLIGATPVRQQGALMIGVLASVLAVGWTAYGLNSANVREYKLDRAFAVGAEPLTRSTPIESREDPGKAYKFVRLTEVPVGVTYQKMGEEDGKAKLLTVQAIAGNYLVDSATAQAVYLREDGIGGGRLQAPQATLMATVIGGILSQKLPWDLILIGAAIAIFIELLGFRALTFAVGVYLPLAATMPVFLGGLVRKIADRKYQRVPDADDEPEGTLYSSGLIAGASILGILAAMEGFLPGFNLDTGLLPSLAFLRHLPFGGANVADNDLNDNPLADLFGFGLLCLLGWLMFRAARPPAARPAIARD